MNKETLLKLNLDHFETIEELEKDLMSWIKEEDIYSFDRYLNKEDVLIIVKELIKRLQRIDKAIEWVEHYKGCRLSKEEFNSYSYWLEKILKGEKK